MKTPRKSALRLGTLAVVAALALAGCTPSPGTSSGTSTKAASSSDMQKALNTPTTLTFWTWVPNIQKEVDLFQQKYPKIKVKVVNVGAGADEYTKLRAALKAGKGAPDVAQIEFQYISSFRQTKNLVDLTPYGAAAEKGKYVDWIWNQVALDGGVWSVPQDSGPMGSLYRTDIFKKAGITKSPETWADYAKAAQTIKSKTGAYIADLPGNDPGQMVGLFWQAGAKPFGYDGKKTVTVDLNSAKAQQVVKFWEPLVQKGLVGVDADFNDAWYQGLSRGKYASWQTAAWGPVFLQGTAKNTSGKWMAAKLPQWNAGDDLSGNWGGSSDAVLNTSQNKLAAYALAKFINSDPAPTLKFATEQFLFPVTTATLQDSKFVDQKAPFYGGQQVNKFFAGVSNTVDKQFEWLPFMDYVYSSYNTTLGKAISDRGDMSAALAKWQDQVTAYAKQQGFTVK
jgi:multiple sugar transport system substrate-binding protein